MNRKKINVCIATYNGEAFIEEQLLSILNQLEEDSEVIISDDHSTDQTIERIQAINDPRIKIFINEKPANPVTNMENALQRTSGDLIFLADQDDIWFPEKVQTIVPLMDSFDLVVSDAVVIDQFRNILNPSFFIANKSKRGFIRNWYRNSFLGCCMVFNRKILDYVLPFPDKIAMHDIWIGLNAVLIGKYFLLPQPLIYYRRHGKNVSPGSEKSGFTVSYMIWYRVFIMYHVLLRASKSYLIKQTHV